MIDNTISACVKPWEAVAFLEARGWNPRRLRRALAECEANPHGSLSEAERCADSVLEGFVAEARRWIRLHVQNGGNLGDQRCQDLSRRAGEAVRLMSRPPAALLEEFPGSAPVAGPPSHGGPRAA
jgi:hypothetical protein